MMQKTFSTLYHWVTYFLAPPFCLFCSTSLHERKALCASCAVQILPIVPFDLYCGKNKLIRVFAFSAYKDPIKTLLLSKLYQNQTYVHATLQFVIDATPFEYFDFDYIFFIPLHWTRYAQRGFNQAEMLALAIAQKTGKPVISALRRCKKTQFQARLSAEQRQANVQDAFIISEKYTHLIEGKKILLVDDLFTTGSTIQAAASVLWKYKPAKIDVFVVCRVVAS